MTAFLPKIAVLENLNFDLEKSWRWKSRDKMHMKKRGNPELLFKFLYCKIGSLACMFPYQEKL